ncbi:hypothetical protein PILCRDRAFT_5113 [Piloderma croceum F 1598]|uniref:Uncharacterized protein n=1 Tax=Piloderma croceum (strain F 1598) TaxID=765440 RepID=A0A0C3FPF3_PILCF|nr:hypothetical protein PILCRDRAFT_5113 [Piloderma croceum F 1598]
MPPHQLTAFIKYLTDGSGNNDALGDTLVSLNSDTDIEDLYTQASVADPSHPV